jgi:single-stranded-DNA-specific exonuclease
MPIWITPPSISTDALTALNLHPLAAQTLTRRGIATLDSARAFLDPRSYQPAPASALPGMDSAVARIASAIRARESICVWGDFDVDGQTSTTVLVETLRALGADVTYHIPVRARESHGVNVPHLKEIIDNGAQLIVTCDTGISANEAVAYARTRNVDFVVTDHHDLPDELPQAVVIVNPKLLPRDHPLATLAGVGVAYKLAEALIETFRPVSLQTATLLDLVALGLVADLAILRGDARYLTQLGLETLRNTQRLGLKAIYELADLQPATITESHIGFTLGPRLNALGRLGDANPMVELLTTSDRARANVLAVQLEGLNAQRKLLCDQVTHAAEAQLRADPALLAQPIIILHHPTWPGGVIGIVASRLVERYQKPAILLTGKPEEGLHGSARSVEGLHITEAIAAQRDLLTNFGGHPMAAGLGLAAENLDTFRRRIARTVESMFGESARAEPELIVDGWFPLPELTLDLADQLSLLAPFGAGNPHLVLAVHGLKLTSTQFIGKNKEHLKLKVEDEAGNQQSVLWWGAGGDDLPDEISSGARFDLAYTLRASDFRGAKQIALEFVDWRMIPEEAIKVKKTPIEIVDYRKVENPLAQLSALNLQPPPVIWAEGAAKKQINGADRNELKPAETLIVWSTPPAPDVFREAIKRVQPKRVIVFAQPADDSLEGFLKTLMGLVKFALRAKNGETSLTQLCGATGAREGAVLSGLEWLSAHGDIEIQFTGEKRLLIKPGSGTRNEALEDQARAAVESILQETRAYRDYFSKEKLDF